MYKIPLFLALSLILQAGFKPVVIKPNGKAFTGQNCAQGYYSSIERLDNENPAKVVNTRSYELKDLYGDNTPLNRTYGITFTVGGDNSAAHNVVSSTSILKDAAQKIISKCPNLGLVDFAVYRTSWGRTFGILDKDQIKEFSCMSDLYPNYKGGRGLMSFPSGIDFKWGYTSCSN